MEKNIIIFDLDGTLAIIDERREKAMKQNGKINWKIFFSDELIKDDLPNVPVIKTANLFHQNGFKIYIFSGRSDKTSDITIQWLKKYNVPFDLLKMRKNNDTRPDEIIKKEFVLELGILENIFLILDDREKVVKMWRSLGLECFQVNEGKF
jgi:phosphoglycolate phosphatase-like HAD superfamily hydrolase